MQLTKRTSSDADLELRRHLHELPSQVSRVERSGDENFDLSATCQYTEQRAMVISLTSGKFF